MKPLRENVPARAVNCLPAMNCKHEIGSPPGNNSLVRAMQTTKMKTGNVGGDATEWTRQSRGADDESDRESGSGTFMKTQWLAMHGRRFGFIVLGLSLLLSPGLNRVQAGAISGSYSDIPLGSVVDLTAAGPADWVHWGLESETSLNRKMFVPAQISDYTPLLGLDGYVQFFQYPDNWNGYSWSDGMPNLSAINSTTGLYAYSAPVAEGVGFEITAPADTRQRTLRVYVGVYSGEGEITATLSDNSATPYVESSLSHNNNGVSRIYIINYAADSAAQSLRVSWRLAKKLGGLLQSPNVTLQAAALATPGINVPPGITLLAPTNTTQFLLGQPIPIVASCGDVDGNVTNVTFFRDVMAIGETTNSPHQLTWTNAPSGIHRLTAVATDDAGESTTSPPIEIVVHGTDGFLAGALNSPPPGSVDLTFEGTSDWIHWGLASANSLDRNATVSPLITTFTQLGTNPRQQLPDSSTLWLWANGSPTLNNAGSTSGIFVYGKTNGFELAIPATPQPQMLKVYAGLYGAQIGFRAHLSDFSAPAHYDTLSSPLNTVDGVFTVQFASASPGQTLFVRLQTEKLLDLLYGNLRLMSATLQVDNSIVPPFRLLDPRRVGEDFLFSFNTLTNHSYLVEWSDTLTPPSWMPLTNYPGTGSRVTITNAITAPGARFYRVTTQ
jgi:hypothetical protein